MHPQLKDLGSEPILSNTTHPPQDLSIMENALSAFVLSSDPQALFATKKMLLTYGIRTTFCRTNADSIAALKQKRFDLFILDYDLRGAADLLQSAFTGGYGHARN